MKKFFNYDTTVWVTALVTMALFTIPLLAGWIDTSSSPVLLCMPVWGMTVGIVIGAVIWHKIKPPPKIHKMYCIFSKEAVDAMKGNRGKLAAQAGHAFLHASWIAARRFNDAFLEYQKGKHAYKISLVVPSAAELQALEAAYKDVAGTSLVTDAGFTVFAEPTITCLGIGPISEDKIGEDLKVLKVLI